MPETITIKVTKDDLTDAKCDEYSETIRDYPLYAATSNLCRADIALLAKLMDYELGNETTLEVTIKVNPKQEK